MYTQNELKTPISGGATSKSMLSIYSGTTLTPLGELGMPCGVSALAQRESGVVVAVTGATIRTLDVSRCVGASSPAAKRGLDRRHRGPVLCVISFAGCLFSSGGFPGYEIIQWTQDGAFVKEFVPQSKGRHTGAVVNLGKVMGVAASEPRLLSCSMDHSARVRVSREHHGWLRKVSLHY